MRQYVMDKLGSTLACAIGLHSWCGGWTQTKVAGGHMDLRSCECERCRHAMLAKAGVVRNV